MWVLQTELRSTVIATSVLNYRATSPAFCFCSYRSLEDCADVLSTLYGTLYLHVTCAYSFVIISWLVKVCNTVPVTQGIMTRKNCMHIQHFFSWFFSICVGWIHQGRTCGFGGSSEPPDDLHNRNIQRKGLEARSLTSRYWQS